MRQYQFGFVGALSIVGAFAVVTASGIGSVADNGKASRGAGDARGEPVFAQNDAPSVNTEAGNRGLTPAEPDFSQTDIYRKCFSEQSVGDCDELVSGWEMSRIGRMTAVRAFEALGRLCQSKPEMVECKDVAAQNGGIDIFEAMDIAVAVLGEGVRRVIPYRDGDGVQRIAVHYLQGKDTEETPARRFVGLLEQRDDVYVLTWRERHGELRFCMNEMAVEDIDGDGASEILFNNCDGCSCHISTWTNIYSLRHQKVFTIDEDVPRPRLRYSDNLKNPQAPAYLAWHKKHGSIQLPGSGYGYQYLDAIDRAPKKAREIETLSLEEKAVEKRCAAFFDAPGTVWTLFGGGPLRLYDGPLTIDTSVCESSRSGLVYGISSWCELSAELTVKKKKRPTLGTFEVKSVSELYAHFDPHSAAELANELFKGDSMVIHYIISAAVTVQPDSLEAVPRVDHPSCSRLHYTQSLETGGIKLDVKTADGKTIYRRDYGYRSCAQNGGKWHRNNCSTPIRLRLVGYDAKAFESR